MADDINDRYMAKRDFIYDTKGGRISLAIIAVFLLVMGIVLLVLSILLGRADKDGFWQTFILGTASIIYGVCNLIVLKKRPPRVLPDDDVADVPETVTEPTQLPQEPDELIVVNPTKANDPEGSILLYRKEGVLVYGDMQIPLDMITDVSMKNVSDPYILGAYHLLLVLSNGQVAHIPAGQDREWANEALIQLRDAVLGKADAL
jgi:hypothetical protein